MSLPGKRGPTTPSHHGQRKARLRPMGVEGGGWLEGWAGGGLLQLLQSGVQEHQEFLGTLQELGETGQRLCCV